MATFKKIAIAARDEVFDKLFAESTQSVIVNGKESEKAYQAKNDALRLQISRVAAELFDAAFIASHIEIGWDWWPNNTRYVEVTIDAFTQPFFDAICGLLVGEFRDWRIQVIVYALPSDGQSMVGSLAIWSDELLIDRPAFAVLKWRGIVFRSETEAIWIEADNAR